MCSLLNFPVREGRKEKERKGGWKEGKRKERKERKEIHDLLSHN